MDYEKKYNEALEKARKLKDQFVNLCITEGCSNLEFIFPELQESEDEKIRKDLIGGLMWQRDNLDAKGPHDNNLILPGFCLTVGEHLAWLEKQKEPIPIPDKFSGLKSIMLQYLQSAANRKDDAEIENDTDLWGRKILGYVWKYSDEEKQKEQKPTEMYPIENCDYELEIALDILEETLGKVEGYQTDDGIREHQTAIQAVKDIMKEQKPVEIHIDNPNIQKIDPDVKITTSDSSASGDELLYVCNKSYNIGYRDGKAEKQKPIDNEDEYLDKDNVYAIMTKLTNLSYSQLIPINSNEYKKIHEITSDVRSLLDHPIEQKPAEWSEEQKLTWEDVRLLCDVFMDTGLTSELPARSKAFYEEVLKRFRERKGE